MRYGSSRAKCFQHFSTYCVCVCAFCGAYHMLNYQYLFETVNVVSFQKEFRSQCEGKFGEYKLSERANERTKERNSWAMASWNDLALSGIGEVSHHHQSQYNEKTTANTRNKKLAQQYRLCAHEWDTYQLPFNVHENAKTTATAAAAAEANNFSNVTNRVD